MRQASRFSVARLSGVVFASTLLALGVTTAALFVPAAGVRPAHAGEADGDTGPEAPAEHEFLQKTVAGQPLPRHAYYVAAASGGVWVSRDAGSTFSPAWPADATQAIGAVATGPDGALYAGTGEVN